MSTIKMNAAEFKNSGIVRDKKGRYSLPDPDAKPRVKPEKKNKFGAKSGYWTDGMRVFFMHSLMESNYARLLNYWIRLKIITAWDYEPDVKTFHNDPKSSIRSYVPDFKVFFPDGHWEYHEIKGYSKKQIEEGKGNFQPIANMKKKLKLMRQYYPSEIVKLITYDEYNALKKAYGNVPGWGMELLKTKPIIKRSA